MASETAISLLEQRNAIARTLDEMRATGTVDPAEVARLRAAKDQADAALDALVGPEPAPLTLRQLIGM